MSNPTPHLNLNRPAQTDFYNVDVFNENADRIDAAIGRIEGGFVPPSNAFTGISAQAAGTVARTATVATATPFERNVGTVVWVRFQNRVTGSNTTLNINSTGAARIRVRNGNDASLANFITPDRYYCFLFTNDATMGASWQLLNPDGEIIPRTVSTTPEGTLAKVAALPGFSRVHGVTFWVTFSTHNTAASPTLNISSTGAANINFGLTRQLIVGRRYAFAFDGSAYQLVATDLSGEKDGFSEVTTAAGTIAKVANIPEFVRQRGSTVWLRFVTGNTAANPTLNVNSTSAALIQFNGGVLPAGAITAGGVFGFVFDGTTWQILNPTTNVSNSTGTLPIANGGTGQTVNPSMLTNLGTTTAANVLTASPRPGVTGTLSAANGGTGQTTLQATRNAMGLGNTTGALPVANGGTGRTTLTSGQVLTGAGTAAINSRAITGTASLRSDMGFGTGTGALPVANGGTGLTTSPSMLTNLGTTTAANVLAASPRPGVTGTLPVANGGTGATAAAAARTNLGITGGAWTPVLGTIGNLNNWTAFSSSAYIGRSGNWRRIGDTVFLDFDVRWSGAAPNSNAELAISGVPNGLALITGENRRVSGGGLIHIDDLGWQLIPNGFIIQQGDLFIRPRRIQPNGGSAAGITNPGAGTRMHHYIGSIIYTI